MNMMNGCEYSEYYEWIWMDSWEYKDEYGEWDKEVWVNGYDEWWWI